MLNLTPEQTARATDSTSTILLSLLADASADALEAEIGYVLQEWPDFDPAETVNASTSVVVIRSVLARYIVHRGAWARDALGVWDELVLPSQREVVAPWRPRLVAALEAAGIPTTATRADDAGSALVSEAP